MKKHPRTPYFDPIIEGLSDQDANTEAAFGKHVHWGYWHNPGHANGSSEKFGEAAEELCKIVCDRAGVQPGMRLIDVGCGFGGTIASLNQRFSNMELVGANIDPRQLANFVIAVSVTAKMELEFARNRPDTPTNQMKSASTLQTVLRSYLVQSANINAIGVQPADIVIEPDVTAFDLTAFTRTDELAAVGQQTTRQAIPQIRQLLAQMDSQLFPPSSQNEN